LHGACSAIDLARGNDSNDLRWRADHTMQAPYGRVRGFCTGRVWPPGDAARWYRARMRLPFELAELHYFRAIVRAGSLSAAARALGLTQPTLSTALRRLEARLETTLFERGRDGVRLTVTGRALAGYAEELLAGAERAQQAVRGLETDVVGRFTVACPDALGAYFLPGLLAHLFRVTPRLELAIWNGNSREVERAVVARDAHFGLVARMQPHPELVKVDLFEDVTELVALAPGGGPIAAARARLRGGPLLYADRMPQEPELLRMLAARGLAPTRLVACGTTELVKAMALAGVGVAILPRRVAASGTAGRLATLHRALPRIPDTISLIRRADLHRTHAANRLKDELAAHGARIAAEA
jgi:DNA-binding transcriptional LysR family regulator